MKSAFVVSLLALGLAACEPQKPAQIATPNVAPPAVAAPAAGAACDAHALKPWIVKDGTKLTIEALASGPTCDKAVALLAVRGPDQAPLYNWSGITAQIFGLTDAKNSHDMTAALTVWVNPNASQFSTSDQLPDWDKTAGQKKPDEFPFHPVADLDKAGWDALRKAKLDVFCFPQGGESLNCAVLRDGQMEEIGLQQFPG